MFVVQNELRPGEIQNALMDLMRDGVSRVRMCSAYMSRTGSDILFDAICRAAPGGDHERVGKIIVTSLDFGLTDPAALRFWSRIANSRVLVAGRSSMERGSLFPYAAFHPKPDGQRANDKQRGGVVQQRPPLRSAQGDNGRSPAGRGCRLGACKIASPALKSQGPYSESHLMGRNSPRGPRPVAAPWEYLHPVQ